jgi:hypothetical protein
MQVTKFRRQPGLVPVGRHFATLSRDLRDANAREAERQALLDQEDRDLEALYRRRSASRENIYAGAAL